jgi:hypothetical protein
MIGMVKCGIMEMRRIAKPKRESPSDTVKL